MPQEDALRLAEKIWNYLCLHTSLRKADIIVVLGGGDLSVFEYGIELYKKGYAPYICCSGGGQERETFKKYGMSEAEKFLLMALAAEIPRNKIYLESKSNNTKENIINTKNYFIKNNLYFNSVIFIQEPYSERRVEATCIKYWSKINFQVTAPLENWNKKLKLTSPDFMIHRVVGSVYKLLSYSKKGDIQNLEIPYPVMQNYEKLFQAGYTKFV